MSPPPTFYTDPATVPISPTRPLLIVDADEVLLAFAGGFGRFLDERGLYLDLVSYRLHGNVRRQDDKSPLIDIEVTGLLDEFRTELDWLDMVEGASAALAGLAPLLDIVILSNVNAAQAPARLRNLAQHGFSYPLVTNSGMKGAAVKMLSRRAGRPVFFVDDIPQHHTSVSQDAPDVLRIHLIGDERLKKLLPLSPDANFRADNWAEAKAFIRTQLAQEAAAATRGS